MIITTSSSATNQGSLVNLHQRLAVVQEEEKKAEEDVVMPIASDKLEGEKVKDAKKDDLLHQPAVVEKVEELQQLMEGHEKI